MKLDKRINKDCKIYSCFDAEQAQEYIDTKGYFADHYENFDDVEKLFNGTLKYIDNDSAFPYEFYNDEFGFSNDRFSNSFKFFLPEKFVKKEKKLRPYKNISEFWNSTGCKIIGSHSIYIRIKDTKREEILLYTGFSFGNDAVHLGGHVLTFETLFYNYEFLHKGDWMPFGVYE